ncbi:MAG: DegV family protein [Atopobium sp.]|uniref:DegV family protein n=1 Tax=Atopobium sp. TaxID=1872650 RepID=UPI002A75BE1C|nr:DegV family protein [Atopobium sp.]MDY2789121.1 DegV family protein [Atopobium sp.]MDY4522613.1 DegV family protein [Atopobium sp.]
MSEVTYNTASYAIVTDTACDLPSEWLAEKNVCAVPMYIHMRRGKTLRDYVDVCVPDFYITLAQAEGEITTSTPSVEEYKAIYQNLLAQGYDHVISVHASSLLSGSYGTAVVAARALDAEDKIIVMDSKTVSAAQGFIVEDLVASRSAGVSFEEAIAHARTVREYSRMYLVPAPGCSIGHNGRRVTGVRGKTHQLLARMSGTRELFMLDENGGFIRISSGKLLVRLAGAIVREMSVYSHEHGPVAYAEIGSGMPRDLAMVEKPMNTNEFEKRRIRISNVCAAAAVHVGVGAIGVAFVPDGLIGALDTSM